MSRADDKIRQDLRSLERPVDAIGVLERIELRKRRRRSRHRVEVVGLAVLVVAGTALGTLGLARLVGPERRVPPAGGGSPGPTPTTVPAAQQCLLRSMDTADLNGDGRDDLVEVYFEPPSPETTCLASDRPGTYFAHLEISTGVGTAQAYTQELPECETFGCGPFAGPDLDGDGRDEVAITLVLGGPTSSFGLYRFDPSAPDGRALQRFEVAEPGDPWSDMFGTPPGPSMFAWYGSVTHQHWMSCEAKGRHQLAAETVVLGQDGESTYHWHGVWLRVEGLRLVPDGTWDRFEKDRPGEPPQDFCGSPIVTG